MTIVLPAKGGSPQLQHYLREAESLLRAGDRKRATALSAEAVSKGCEHLKLLTLATYEHINRGDPEMALRCASRACELGPRDPDALNVLGLSLARVNRFREALTVYDAALRQAPSAAHLHYNKGRALEDLNELGPARRQYERTLNLQAAHPEALARLASFAALRGETTAAREYAGRALRYDPGSTAAMLALALADIEDRQFEAAILRLQPLTPNTNPSVLNRAIALGLLGDALDGIDRTVAAFAAYTESNGLLRDLYGALYKTPEMETASQRVERMLSYFRNYSGEWDAPRTKAYWGGIHVFLVGFPRSGTTLLEQILDAHPDVEAMSERDCLLDAANEYVLLEGGLEKLSVISEGDVAKHAEVYWKRVSTHGHSAKKRVFVDKMPLNSVLLFLIAKLFPGAKILFAVRDPRDVVLSCFRRRFGMSAQMYELLGLQTAARYYDLVMQLSSLAHTKSMLSFHYVEHEKLVSDFQNEGRKLCDFLGMAFDPAMQGFVHSARWKDINTPSAAQVSRGLNTAGIGQWQRYREQLAPVMPVLAPWVAHYGYEGA